MRKANNMEIQWYEPDDNRRRPTATLKSTGALCFGAQMREELSMGKIRVGFIADENVIAVQANSAQGSALSQDGEVNLSLMAKKFRRLGVRLPATFLFFYEAIGDIWKGYLVLPPRKVHAASRMHSDEGASIIAAYKWLIDKIVYTAAKTTPIEERRGVATAALWEAICSYSQAYGDLTEYLHDEIKRALLEQNKIYVKENPYTHISLNTSHGLEVCELLLPRYKNEMLAVENRLYLDEFREKYLNRNECRILKRLLDGYTAEEIQREFKMTQDELFECCKDVGKRWSAYNSDDVA